MSIATKSAIGVGVGTAMAGVAWYILREQDRMKLIELLTDDKKIPIMRAIAPFTQVPKNLQVIAEGKFEEFAEEQIKYFETKSPQVVYAAVTKSVTAFLSSIPDNTLEKALKALGVDPGLLGTVKNVLELIGLDSGGSSTGQNKQRPGT
jgi:hypothetical protein